MRCAMWLGVWLLWAAVAQADALDRLTSERLERVHGAVETLASQRTELPRQGPYHEYRVNLHVHSAFSHDSRGQLPNIVAAAKRAGSDVLMFTEHPAEHYDFVMVPLRSPLSKMLGFKGPLTGRRVVEINDVYIVAFFDKYLNGANVPLLDGPSDDYPEVVWETWR